MKLTTWIPVGLWILSATVHSQLSNIASFYPTCSTANRRAKTIIYESSYKSAYEDEYESSRTEAKTAAADKYTQDVCPHRKATEIDETCDPDALQRAINQARLQAEHNRNTALTNAKTETANSLYAMLEFCIPITDSTACNNADGCFYSTKHGNKCIPVSLAV